MLAYCALPSNRSVLHSKHGMSLSFSGYLAIAGMYADALNKGDLPCIQSAVEVMREKECQEALRHAIHFYMQVSGSVLDIICYFTSEFRVQTEFKSILKSNKSETLRLTCSSTW